VTLLARPGVRARAQLVARRVTDLLPTTAAVVHVKETTAAAFTAVAMSGDVKVAAQLQISPIGRVAILEGPALRRETYAHLDVRRLPFTTLLETAPVVNLQCPLFKRTAENQFYFGKIEGRSEVFIYGCVDRLEPKLATSRTGQRQQNQVCTHRAQLAQGLDALIPTFADRVEIQQQASSLSCLISCTSSAQSRRTKRP
jgi:hypothetical protein